MKEYLIRRKDNDFCEVKLNRFDDVLRPNSFESTKIEGWGHHRIQVDNCAIAFSFEEVGIQISFENCEISDKKAQKIVDEICLNVEKEINSSCYSIQISD
ncbi:hypothetical protein BH20ACI4_BH20ACI4_31290 [soil metagenome]